MESSPAMPFTGERFTIGDACHPRAAESLACSICPGDRKAFVFYGAHIGRDCVGSCGLRHAARRPGPTVTVWLFLEIYLTVDSLEPLVFVYFVLFLFCFVLSL